MKRMLHAALRYAKAGFPVFPVHTVRGGKCSCGKLDCRSPGKHPRTSRGFIDATTDRKKIKAWWTEWPDSNIGMPTGSVSGLLVLDVDPRNGGYKSLAKVLIDSGPLPPTAKQQTGGGGRHLFFRYSGLKMPKTLAPGIDVKADGGYVVVAPSIHQSGKRYKWRI
jgi:hypothetical protein